MRGVCTLAPAPHCRGCAILRTMTATCEAATFLPADPGCLVEASLACSVCLSSRIDSTLVLDGYDPSVECACRECGHVRRVFLTPEQALRLSLHVERPVDLAPREPGLGLAI